MRCAKMTRRVPKRGSTLSRVGRPRIKRSSRESARDGFTLIELIVAIVILVVGILGLAGTAGMVSRMVGGAGQQTLAATVASSRFEKLRSVPCTQLKSGSEVTRHVTERWTVDQDPNSDQLWVVTDTITYNAAGGRAPRLTFQSYVRCN